VQRDLYKIVARAVDSDVGAELLEHARFAVPAAASTRAPVTLAICTPNEPTPPAVR
jgi:hypothetical protein